MTIKERLKELFFEFTHDPNSPEGLLHRADILVKKGVSNDNPMVTALRKMAEELEKQGKSERVSWFGEKNT